MSNFLESLAARGAAAAKSIGVELPPTLENLALRLEKSFKHPSASKQDRETLAKLDGDVAPLAAYGKAPPARSFVIVRRRMRRNTSASHHSRS